MTKYKVFVQETRTIMLEVEAPNDIEAGRLVEEDINKYPVIDEEVTFWEVDYAEEIDIKCQSNDKDNVTYNEVDYVEQCITEGHDYRDCVDTLVGNMVASDDNKTDKVYPQVDDVPDNIKKEWLYDYSHDSEGC